MGDAGFYIAQQAAAWRAGRLPSISSFSVGNSVWGAKDLAPAIGIDNSDLRDPPMNDIFFRICLAAFAIGTIGVIGQIIDEILERRRWMEWMSSPAETARREQNRTARRKRNREMAIFMIIYIGCASLACIDHWVRWPSNP